MSQLVRPYDILVDNLTDWRNYAGPIFMLDRNIELAQNGQVIRTDPKSPTPTSPGANSWQAKPAEEDNTLLWIMAAAAATAILIVVLQRK